VLLLADEALTTTIVQIAIWGVLFPALVTGLLIYAVVIARGERRENEEYKRRHEP
jgi:hypothetical protein